MRINPLNNQRSGKILNRLPFSRDIAEIESGVYYRCGDFKFKFKFYIFSYI